MAFGKLHPSDVVGVDPEAHPQLCAERVPRICDFCGDDSDFIFEVRVNVFTLEGERMKGKRICEICIAEQGFTGWGYAHGGWPMRDPLGRAHPPEAETDPPMDWREIGAALEGRALLPAGPDPRPKR